LGFPQRLGFDHLALGRTDDNLMISCKCKISRRHFRHSIVFVEGYSLAVRFHGAQRGL